MRGAATYGCSDQLAAHQRQVENQPAKQRYSLKIERCPVQGGRLRSLSRYDSTYATDARMANAMVGLTQTPTGLVWHHVEDGLIMMLLPKEVHSTPHTGGAAVIRNGGGFDK